ncbi:MAG: 3-deoxy-8-phosphooctulonate synthase [Pseudomonadota bacterium]|nr:3-deoxy-8-phosphooctulonate synthase [Pseudomonadota bacterium]
MKQVKVSNIYLSNNHPLTLIAGLNVLEEKEIIFEVVETCKEVTSKLKIPFIFKASYDKANRSSIHSFRGPGIDEGLEVLKKVRSDYGVPIISDIHSIEEVEKASKVLDIIQIPAFLCRQTDLLASAAASGLPVNLKKGQFLSPSEVGNIIGKFDNFGSENLLICERGTSFGYNNLIVDMIGLAELKSFGYPVIFDVTHSLQLPGGLGDKSSGRRPYLLDLAKSAVSIGIAGLFLEVHPDPDNAKCDGPSALPLSLLTEFLYQIISLDKVIKKLPGLVIN